MICDRCKITKYKRRSRKIGVLEEKVARLYRSAGLQLESLEVSASANRQRMIRNFLSFWPLFLLAPLCTDSESAIPFSKSSIIVAACPVYGCNLFHFRRWIEQAIIDWHVVTQVTAVRHHRQEHDVKGGFKMVAQKKTDFQGNNYLQLSTITIYNHLQLPYNRYTINGWAQAFRVTGAFMGLVPLPDLA
jgi:hypothetical protein